MYMCNALNGQEHTSMNDNFITQLNLHYTYWATGLESLPQAGTYTAFYFYASDIPLNLSALGGMKAEWYIYVRIWNPVSPRRMRKLKGCNENLRRVLTANGWLASPGPGRGGCLNGWDYQAAEVCNAGMWSKVSKMDVMNVGIQQRQHSILL